MKVKNKMGIQVKLNIGQVKVFVFIVIELNGVFCSKQLPRQAGLQE